jgi:hypothetical protein
MFSEPCFNIRERSGSQGFEEAHRIGKAISRIPEFMMPRH